MFCNQIGRALLVILSQAKTSVTLLKTMTTVVVIGAGVVGLSTAIRLLEHGYRVILLAKQFPSSTSILDIPSHDYSTFWAGANWLDFSEKGQLVLQSCLYFFILGLI